LRITRTGNQTDRRSFPGLQPYQRGSSMHAKRPSVKKIGKDRKAKAFKAGGLWVDPMCFSFFDDPNGQDDTH
jgi:hypothetical protein